MNRARQRPQPKLERLYFEQKNAKNAKFFQFNFLLVPSFFAIFACFCSKLVHTVQGKHCAGGPAGLDEQRINGVSFMLELEFCKVSLSPIELSHD